MTVQRIDWSRLDQASVNFIVGPGRSGTTLLVYAFNQHRNCVASPEIKHLMYFYNKYKDVKTVTQSLLDDYRSYLEMYVQNKVFFMSKLERTWLDELRVGDEITYSRLSKLFYFCLAADKQDISEVSCILDKNPVYTFYLDELFALFPEAKVLFMIRDPRAYVLSHRQSRKSGMRILSVYYYAGIWNLYVDRIMKAKARYGNSIRIVRYEDMAAGKEQVIEDISQFVGLSYTPDMLNFYRRVRDSLQTQQLSVMQYERAMKKLHDLSAPINTTRVYAWQSQLSEKDIGKTEFMCAAFTAQLGYAPASTPLSLFRTMACSIASIPARFRLMLFRRLATPATDHYLYKKHAKS